MAAYSKMRPAKIRNAARRRWFETRVPRLDYADAPPLVELGSSYGGWRLPDGLIEPGWVCYCVGAGGDVTFDIDLMRRHDATVRSIDPVEEYVERALAEAGGDPRFSVHQVAVAVVDGPIRMQRTHDTNSGSVSPAGLYESDSYIELPGRSLPSLMAELGDTRIDLLKIDVEGGEYELLPTLDLNGLGVKVFAIQLHHTGTVADARKLLGGLRDAGYLPVACRPAVKLAFAHRDVLVRSAERLLTGARTASAPPSRPRARGSRRAGREPAQRL